MSIKTVPLIAIVVPSLGLLACNPLIGDDCQTSIDCSEQGSRFCDRNQPGGYCTIVDCEPNSCPAEAACVQFFDGVHARNYCMRQCEKDSTCRERYFCTEAITGLSTILDDPFPHRGYCAPRTE